MTNQSLRFDELDSSRRLDYAAFDPIVATLPGGSYLHRRWVDEPRHLVLVRHDDQPDVCDAIQRAFPYHLCGQMSSGESRWIAAVPTLAVQMLTAAQQRRDCSLDVSSAELDAGTGAGLPALAAIPVGDAPALVAYLDHLDPSGWLSLDDNAYLGEEIAELCAQRQLRWRDVVEFVDDTFRVDVDALDATLELAFS